ncbi:hypothetical protein BGZ60DRAFT_41089 [Tricladium varicosporioides]|nr:hypothetical protein BGZ60DRAFT_41089 [Hymenoscyphus varicosporioides]
MSINQNAICSSTPDISPNTCPSLASTLSSSSDSPSRWEARIATPVSTPLEFPVNLEDSYISSPSLSSYYTPEKRINNEDFYSDMSHDMSMGFQESQISFTRGSQLLQDQSMIGYNFIYSPLTMQSCHALPHLTASLDFAGCSPRSFSESSPTPVDFVMPSQTTFDPFGIQSPIRQINSLHIDLQYTDDYTNEFIPGNSPVGNLRCYQGSTIRSCSSTPSRSATSATSRRPIFEPTQSTKALQRVQTLIKEDLELESKPKLRTQHRKMKRDSRHPQLPDNIQHAEAATKSCLHPGCGKKFRRSEHLKRHARIHTPAFCEKFKCPFCNKIFVNRSDNLKQHVKIHADPTRKTSRTDYIGQAAVDWIVMKDKEIRSSKMKKGEEV